MAAITSQWHHFFGEKSVFSRLAHDVGILFLRNINLEESTKFVNKNCHIVSSKYSERSVLIVANCWLNLIEAVQKYGIKKNQGQLHFWHVFWMCCPTPPDVSRSVMFMIAQKSCCDSCDLFNYLWKWRNLSRKVYLWTWRFKLVRRCMQTLLEHRMWMKKFRWLWKKIKKQKTLDFNAVSPKFLFCTLLAWYVCQWSGSSLELDDWCAAEVTFSIP